MPAIDDASLRQFQHELRAMGLLGRTGLDWGRGFMYAFIGANALVFAGWQASKERPQLAQFLADHFVLSRRNLRQGRWWTRATGALSHQTWDHLSGNLYAFWIYADSALRFGCYDAVGLAALVLGSAVAGSAAQLWEWDRDRRDRLGLGLGARATGLGASAAVNGLAAAVTVLRPLAPVAAPCLPTSVPLYLYTLGYFAYDYFSIGSAASRVGHSAHVGGALFGLSFAVLYRLARSWFGRALL